MGIWIRSSDQTTLVKCNIVYIEDIPESSSEAEVKGCNFEEEFTWSLGVYDKNVAMGVLEQIQQHINSQNTNVFIMP